jgi:hypothetical protein
MTEHDLFSGLTPSRAPSELRAQVLHAARKALAQAAAPRTAWRVLWHSRALRLGWSVACAVLLASHLALALWPRRSPSAGELSSELREVLYLPPTDGLAVVVDYRPVAPDGGAIRRKEEG